MPETEMPVNQNERRGFRRKRYLILGIILIFLIGFRLYLPTYVKTHVNKVLSEIPGYHGQVDDIDIAIFRGAYVIKGMYFKKNTEKSGIPFLKFPKTDISIEWKSIFHGKIVSEIIMNNPEINFIYEDWEKDSTNITTEDWKKILRDLTYFDINHFEIRNGKIAFVQLSTDEKIDLGIDKLELTADNLQNVVERERILPAPIYASGVSKGNGKFSLEGNMNLAKKIPEMDLSFSVENADVTILNSFINHYGGFYFEKGKFSIYGEADLTNADFKGYLKPILSGTELINNENGFQQNLWEGFEGFFNDILKNQETNPLATKISIETKLDNPELGAWSTLIKAFKNSWIQTFKNKATEEIELKKTIPKDKATQKKELKEQKAQRKKEVKPKKG